MQNLCLDPEFGRDPLKDLITIRGKKKELQPKLQLLMIVTATGFKPVTG